MQEVIRRAQEGDPDALAQLWRTYQPQLLRYFRGRSMSEPDDLASIVWIDVAKNLKRFNGDETDFRRWLFTIASRRRVDAIRSSSRQAERNEHLIASTTEPPVADPAELAERSIALDRAIALVRQLPPDMAEAVLLRVVADLSVSDVAAIMGRREGHVRVLVHRGLEKLLSGSVTDPLSETIYEP